MKKETTNQWIGRFIRDYRKARQISLCKLAKSTKVNKSQLSRIEKGNGNPTVETLERISHSTGLSFIIN